MVSIERDIRSESDTIKQSTGLQAPLFKWLTICVISYTITVIVLVWADVIPIHIARPRLGLFIGLGYALIGVFVAAIVLRKARSRPE